MGDRAVAIFVKYTSITHPRTHSFHTSSFSTQRSFTRLKLYTIQQIALRSSRLPLSHRSRSLKLSNPTRRRRRISAIEQSERLPIFTSPRLK